MHLYKGYWSTAKEEVNVESYLLDREKLSTKQEAKYLFPGQNIL